MATRHCLPYMAVNCTQAAPPTRNKALIVENHPTCGIIVSKMPKCVVQKLLTPIARTPGRQAAEPAAAKR